MKSAGKSQVCSSTMYVGIKKGERKTSKVNPTELFSS